MAGRNIGALWRGEKDSKAVLSGVIDLLGMSVRICVFKNEDENKKDAAPDYRIVSYGFAEEKKSQRQPGEEI